jgi:NADH dehydrogenase
MDVKLNPEVERSRADAEPQRSFPIVIIGGGFAGAYCARSLVGNLGSEAYRDVALVADQNFILFHPMLAEVSGSSISPLHVVNPLRRFCGGVSFFLGPVSDIDLDRKIVHFSPGPYMRAAALAYEQLVLAIGSIVDVSRVPGMPEHGYLMKTVGDAIRLRTGLLERLEEASIAIDESLRRRLLTFVVVGGGYSGVETAGQLVDLVRDVQKFYPRIDPKEFRFVLIQSGPHLLPQIGEELGRYAEEQLRKRGVEVRLNARVTAITAERAILNNGEVIETNTVVTTVGNATHPVVQKLIKSSNLPNERGRITTEPTMLVKGFSNLWAVGDCAAVPSEGGGASPATAQFAMRQGTLLGKNLMRVRRGSRPEPFRFKTLGEMASLGHRNAVGKVLGFKVSGFLGWLMWRATYLYKLPGIEDKIKVFFEWSLELLFPRDISLLDIKTTDVLGRVHLEKGDPVYQIGDRALSFYIVEKGRLQVSDTGGPVRIINRGEHFGERELLKGAKRQFNVEALEPSTLVALDKQTFETLAQNSLTLGYLLSRSSVRYLTAEERHSLVDRAQPSVREKTVADFLLRDIPAIRESALVIDALKTFKQAQQSMLPVFDFLHQGTIISEKPVSEVVILPAETVKEHDKIGDVLLRFSQTPDRAFVVVAPDGKYVGTISLLDVVLASQEVTEMKP